MSDSLTLAVRALSDSLTLSVRALRRKHVLDTYGITIENVEYEEWLTVISSNERLERWFDAPLPHYVIDDLARIG